MTTRTALLLIAASSSITQPAFAQSDDREEAVDRIIVTGARVPIDASRIGNATTVITREDIEQREARYLADVLRAVPGFAVAASGGAGSQTQVRVRGSEANHVLVLIDGVRANDPATTDEFHWEHFAAGNIERVEIVRGPQSALWGSEAIGGVVNVITRSGIPDEALDGYVESGSHATRNVGANAGGGIGDWTLDGSVESLQTDGTNISRVGDEKDGARLDTATLHARYEGSDRFSFDATIRTTDALSQFDPVDFVTTGLPTDGNLETESDSVVGHVGASFAAGDNVVWHLRAGYYDSSHRNLVDGAWDSATASQRASVGFGADIRLTANELSLAVEREDTDFEQRGQVFFGDPNQNQDMQVTSLIAEYRRLAGRRLTWILSGRYDSYSDFDDALTGKVSAAFQWTGTTRLRASLGTGQKAPTFLDRFGFFPAQFIGNPDLRPESSLSYDIGIDRDLADAAVSLSASLYWQTLDDEIDGFVFDPSTFLFTAENQSTKSRRRGIEAGLDWQASNAIRLGASYTYTDATEGGDSGNAVRELRRPRHSGGVSLSFRPPARRFDAILLADYGGKRDDIFFPPFPAPAQRVTLPHYWLVDATARFRLTSSIMLFVRATNLLDESYEQVFGYATPGRASYFGVRADFGG